MKIAFHGWWCELCGVYESEGATAHDISAAYFRGAKLVHRNVSICKENIERQKQNLLKEIEQLKIQGASAP